MSIIGTGAIIDNIQQQLNHQLKEYFGHGYPKMKDFSIKILQNSPSVFPITDFLLKNDPILNI